MHAHVCVRWSGIEMQLGRMKSNIHMETNRLTASIDDLLKHVDFAWEQTSPLLNTWKSYANQLWLLGLSVTLMTLLVPLTLSIGMLLGSTDYYLQSNENEILCLLLDFR